jgi:Asp-tRNA(Asn)/Glu-tRNA(Gln) amidotransferase A subunit family amidase
VTVTYASPSSSQQVPPAAPMPASANETVAAVATGALTVADAVGACLAAARDGDAAIGAFRMLDERFVEEQVRRLELSGPIGPLHGVAVGVKDVIDTGDLPTGYGSELFAGHEPRRDAVVVERIRRAGGVVLGKTESTEFAMFRPTRTRNPVDLQRTPGGSSSGSAAAVAAGMVPVALGTQTAGSVIRPAAYCGVYGFKPSRGWTPTEGIWRLADSLDTVGVFARTAADLALVYAALADEPVPAPATRRLLPRRRAVVLRCAEWGEADADVHNALDAAATALEADGWAVTEGRLPDGWAELVAHHATVMAVEVAGSLTDRLGARVADISPAARAIVEQGEQCSARDYLRALAARDRARAGTAALAAAGSVVLAPSALGVAPVGLDFTGDPVMCRAWTLLGLPCANVPGFRRPDGLPVGVQAIGLVPDDRRFLQDLLDIETALSAHPSR